MPAGRQTDREARRQAGRQAGTYRTGPPLEEEARARMQPGRQSGGSTDEPVSIRGLVAPPLHDTKSIHKRIPQNTRFIRR